KRAAEIKDSLLFKEHVKEDCPICFLPMPTSGQTTYKSCCGKTLCAGCTYAMVSDGKANTNEITNEMSDNCPFCRKPQASPEEEVKLTKARMEKNDSEAYFNLGSAYNCGDFGLPKDRKMAIDLWFKAAELGNVPANLNLGNAYNGKGGGGVKVDKKKAKHHWEIAAIGGNLDARHNLGIMEIDAGNSNQDIRMIKRALRHFAIAARAGMEPSLDPIKKGFSLGYVTKDEYATILRAYQESKEEMDSDARKTAARLEDLHSKFLMAKDDQEKGVLLEQYAEIFGQQDIGGNNTLSRVSTLSPSANHVKRKFPAVSDGHKA
ncbi:hypothetical protein ACHAWF_001007, partial [Thalassiosira exigua]